MTLFLFSTRQCMLILLLFASTCAISAAPSAHLQSAVRAMHRGDSPRAVKLLLRHAQRGDAEAQFLLVSALQGRDPAQADRWLRAAADRKHPHAAQILGLRSLQGDGVAQDAALSVRWLRIAADGGIAEAQLQLGIYYRNGPNAIQDDTQAAFWIGKAAEAGSAEAQYQFAQLHRFGYGVPTDAGESRKWLKRAAAQGHPLASGALNE